MLRLGVCDPVRQVALTDAFELEWRLAVGAGDSNGIGSEVEEELAGERVMLAGAEARVAPQCRRGRRREETAQGDGDRSVAVVVGWAVPRRHAGHPTPPSADDAVLAIASGRVGRNGTSMTRLRPAHRAFEDAETGHRVAPVVVRRERDSEDTLARRLVSIRGHALANPVFAEAAPDGMALRRRVLHAPDAAGSFVLDSGEAIESDQQFSGLRIDVQVSACRPTISGVDVGATPQGVVPAVAEQARPRRHRPGVCRPRRTPWVRRTSHPR